MHYLTQSVSSYFQWVGKYSGIFGGWINKD